MTFRSNQRGSVLLSVMIASAVMSGMVYLLISAAQTELKNSAAFRAERQGDLIERSVRETAGAAIYAAVRAGDARGASPAFVTAVNSAGFIHSGAEWNTKTAVSLGPIPGNLFDKNVAVTVPLLTPQVSGWGRVAALREGAPIALTTTIRQPQFTDSNGRISIPEREITRTITWIEVPSVEFQMLATSFPLDADASTVIAVNGNLLANAGVIRSDSTKLTVSAMSIIVGAAPAVTAALSMVPVSTRPADWGLADPYDLLDALNTANSHYVNQSYAQMPARFTFNDTGRTITWTDPALPPSSPLPAGISYAIYYGSPRLVIDLATYSDNALFVDCEPATRAAGVVIVGAASGATMGSVSIATNGQVFLVGNNTRVSVIASNYAAPTIFSAAYLGGAPGAASATQWTGYWVFPINSNSFNVVAPESGWLAVGYTLNGSFLFKGGVFSFAAPLTINRAASVVAQFTSGTIRADRFLVLFP